MLGVRIKFEKYRNSAGDEAKAIEANLTADEHGNTLWVSCVMLRMSV